MLCLLSLSYWKVNDTDTDQGSKVKCLDDEYIKYTT